MQKLNWRNATTTNISTIDFKNGKKECEVTNDKKNGFERLERVEIVRVWNRNKQQEKKNLNRYKKMKESD